MLQKLNEKGLEGIDGMTQQNFNYMAAQAKALRGMTYFYLVVFFDTPILYNETNYPEDLMANMSNGDRKELWAQIENDLHEAAQHLKLRSQLSPEEFGRITKGGALSQLGKSLLYKHYYYYERFGQGGSAEAIADLQKAKNAFQEVINSNEYRLKQPKAPKTELDYLYALLSNTSYVDLVSENNTYRAENNEESIWEVQFDDAKALGGNPWFSGYYSSGALNSQWYSPLPSSFKNWEVHPAMYHAFETEGAPAPFDRDPRCKASIYGHGDMLHFDSRSTHYIPFNDRLMVKRVAVQRNLPNRVGRGGLGVKKSHFPVYVEGPLAHYNDPVQNPNY